MPTRSTAWPDAVPAELAFRLKVVRLNRPSLPWICEIHRDGDAKFRERSVRGYRCAEDAWDAGKAPLARFKHQGSPER